MKLLISSDSFLPRWDGVARFLSEIIPKLKYDITVLAPDGPKQKNVIRFKSSKISIDGFPLAKPKRKIIKEEVKKSDLIWIQTMGPIGVYTWYYARKYKKKIMVTIHSIEWELVPKSMPYFQGLIKFIVKKSLRYAYNRVNLLLCPSESIARLYDENKIKTKKQIVHLGLNIKHFKPADTKNAKKKLKINPNKKVIGFVGRIGREKDLPTLFKSFKMIEDKDKYLLIVGGGLQSILDMIKGKNIKKTGSVNNVVPYLQAMDIYVLPSLTETTSLSTLEAMSCGTAVIATPVGAVKDYLINSHNGLLFEKGNSEELKEKIEKLLKNKEFRKNLGKHARSTIIKSFSWNKTVKDITTIIDSITSD